MLPSRRELVCYPFDFRLAQILTLTVYFPLLCIGPNFQTPTPEWLQYAHEAVQASAILLIASNASKEAFCTTSDVSVDAVDG